jgi:hypothetical protein
MSHKRKELADVQAKDFVIFKAGHWNGEDFTEQDLDNMVASYNANEPPHFLLGHSRDYKGKTMIPSWGRIKGGLKRIGNELIACGAEFNEQMAQWIKDGFFNQRSIELTKDNKRILAVGLLGAMPPAVKDMPLMQEVFKESALAFSEFAKSKVIEFADASAIDFETIEKVAVEDTLKNIDQEFATCLSDIGNHLNADDEDEEIKQSCLDALMECYNGVCEEINEHFSFTGKLEQLEQLEPEEVTTMMDKLRGWLGISKSINTTGKETEVEANKEKEYQDRILELETQNKEFAAKEQAAKDTQAKIDADKAAADLVAAEEAKKTEIKNFCDTAISENRMTPAMRETDEPIMFELSKANADALKSFQQKYSTPIVPLGEAKIEETQDNDKRLPVIKNAEKYVKAHPKEFVDLTLEQGISRALTLYSSGQIKFGDEKQIIKGAK